MADKVSPREFIHNVSSHPWEKLAPYADQFVAWSSDGTTILAHGPTEEHLQAEIKRLGLTSFVVDYVWPPDISCLGGADL
jgi:hypothetical protein